jgi:hypothetical protein
MYGLCKYRDALGKPGEGVHAWRIGGLAATDLLMTAAAAFLLSRTAFKAQPPLIGFLVIFVILIVAAVAIHRAFCVDTALNRCLGLAPPPPAKQ